MTPTRLSPYSAAEAAEVAGLEAEARRDTGVRPVPWRPPIKKVRVPFGGARTNKNTVIEDF